MNRDKEYRREATTRQNLKDHWLTQNRLANFDWCNCQARRFLDSVFERMNGTVMLSLAQVISKKLGISLDREATRRKAVLYKWYEENLRRIEDFIVTSVVVETETGRLIGAPHAISRFVLIKTLKSNVE